MTKRYLSNFCSVSMGFPFHWPFCLCNSFTLPSHEDSEGGCDIRHLFLTLTLGTTGTAQLSNLPAGRTLPQEIPWCIFLLEAELNPGLLNADRRNRSLENLQGSYWESSPELQHSHSTIVPYSADQSSLRSTIIQIRQHIVAPSVFRLVASSLSQISVCYRIRRCKIQVFSLVMLHFCPCTNRRCV